MFRCVVKLAVLLVFKTAMVTPVKFVPIEKGTTQGSAVIFFTAYRGVLRELEFNPIVFDQILVNQGSGYSNQTGEFTAPQTGIYNFMFSAVICRGRFNNDWQFTVNNVPKSSCHAQIGDGDATQVTCYLVESLNRGDRVWIKQRADSCAWASEISKTITFSGFLLASRGGLSNSCPLFTMDTGEMYSSVDTAHVSTAALILGLLLSICF